MSKRVTQHCTKVCKLKIAQASARLLISQSQGGLSKILVAGWKAVSVFLPFFWLQTKDVLLLAPCDAAGYNIIRMGHPNRRGTGPSIFCFPC